MIERGIDVGSVSLFLFLEEAYSFFFYYCFWLFSSVIFGLKTPFFYRLLQV